jgi:lipoprotein-releasing system permease protein
MTGFTGLMKEKLLETTAHIQIYGVGRSFIANPERIIKAVEESGGKAAPLVQHQVLIQNDRQITAKMVFGIDPATENDAIANLKHPKAGAFSLEKNEIMISSIIADELGIGVGDKILLHSPQKLARMVQVRDDGSVELNESAERYLPREFKVSGLFSFGKYDFDKTVLFMGIDDAAELFGYPWGSATAVYVWVPDPFRIEEAAESLKKRLPDMNIYTWKQMNSRLLGVLEVEKNMMFFLLIFIVLVAAFSITNTLITQVIQKTREIGLLKALGAGSETVMTVFLLQSFFVGLLGSIAGTILGVVIVRFRNSIMLAVGHLTGREMFPKEFYFFNELPAQIVVQDVVFIAVTSVVLCTIGGVVPAIRAALLDPAGALRYE